MKQSVRISRRDPCSIYSVYAINNALILILKQLPQEQYQYKFCLVEVENIHSIRYVYRVIPSLPIDYPLFFEPFPCAFPVFQTIRSEYQIILPPNAQCLFGTDFITARRQQRDPRFFVIPPQMRVIIKLSPEINPYQLCSQFNIHPTDVQTIYGSLVVFRFPHNRADYFIERFRQNTQIEILEPREDRVINEITQPESP